MKNKKRILYLLIPFLILTLTIAPKVSAGPENNPVLATIDYVQKTINSALSSINEIINTHETRIDLLEERVTELEKRIPTPEPTPIPVTVFEEEFNTALDTS